MTFIPFINFSCTVLRPFLGIQFIEPLLYTKLIFSLKTNTAATVEILFPPLFFDSQGIIYSLL